MKQKQSLQMLFLIKQAKSKNFAKKKNRKKGHTQCIEVSVTQSSVDNKKIMSLLHASLRWIMDSPFVLMKTLQDGENLTVRQCFLLMNGRICRRPDGKNCNENRKSLFVFVPNFPWRFKRMMLDICATDLVYASISSHFKIGNAQNMITGP